MCRILCESVRPIPPVCFPAFFLSLDDDGGNNGEEDDDDDDDNDEEEEEDDEEEEEEEEGDKEEEEEAERSETLAGVETWRSWLTTSLIDTTCVAERSWGLGFFVPFVPFLFPPPLLDLFSLVPLTSFPLFR